MYMYTNDGMFEWLRSLVVKIILIYCGFVNFCGFYKTLRTHKFVPALPTIIDDVFLSSSAIYIFGSGKGRNSQKLVLNI